MSRVMETYLDRVMVYTNRPEPQAGEIRAELRDHLLRKVEDLQKQGLSPEDATYEAVRAHGHPRVVGYGLRRGFPWVDIRNHGTARGVIAIGPKAVGVVAMGGVAVGVFAFGGVAIGGIAFGGIGLAAIFAFCGMGAGTIAYGGMAVGLLAVGGMVAGLVAMGGTSAGILAEGGRAWSYYDPQTAPAFLKSLLALAGTPTFWLWLTWVLTPIMVAWTVVGNILMVRERRRVGAADPWLQE